jgi:uncharacterized protein YcfJ
MKQIYVALALSGLTGMAHAAADTVVQWNWVPVVSTSPVYQQVNTPQQQCWTEQVTTDASPPADRSYGGTVLGGIAGGLLGHTVGKGSGRDAATAIGAVTGAVLGDKLGNQGSGGSVQQTRQEQHCRTVDNWSQQLTGYSVTYRYGGQQYQTILPYDPGSTLQVQVGITPVQTPPAPASGWAPPPPR